MKSTIFCATLALVVAFSSASPFAVQSRIVGGQEADSEAAPFIVSLQWSTETRRHHFCAAVIIDEEWLLTAAHCIQAVHADAVIKAVAGKKNLHEEDNEENQVRLVENIIIHPDFNGGISSDDLALLKVSEAFEWTDSVLPIELPLTKDIPTGSVTVYGWGSLSMEFMPEFPETLQKATMDILDYQECENVLGGEGATPLKESNICTGPLKGGLSTCNGDSGGPLVKTNAEGHKTLIGIISWGFYPCGGENTPSIYARVSAYVNWIEETKQ